MKKYLTYDDVALVPQYTLIDSRSECETETWLGNFQFKLPVMPSNMKCVVDENIAFQLSAEKYFYVMHRFADTLKFVTVANASKLRVISISVGVKKQDRDLIDKIVAQNLRVDYITIDIAHGHSFPMLQMIKYIRHWLPKTFVIAGNVATPKAFSDLAAAGADAVKVGIGQGAACTTKLKTGFTMPMFTCIQDVREEFEKICTYEDPPLIILMAELNITEILLKRLLLEHTG
jgi:GMP reductase